MTVKMIRDGVEADVHDDEVDNWKKAGWSTGEDEETEADFNETLLAHFQDTDPEGKPTIAQVKKDTNLKLTGAVIQATYNQYLAEKPEDDDSEGSSEATGAADGGPGADIAGPVVGAEGVDGSGTT